MKLNSKLVLDLYGGGLMHALLKGPTMLLGKILRRNHDLSRCSDITILKMLGGGSLVIAYPALLALRKSGRIRKLRLMTSPAIRPFGELLGLFDEIIVVRDQPLTGMLGDTLVALRRLFRCDAIVDLEIHSRLTTVFALLTCAMNRIGFYTGVSFWRRGLCTHLLFCNVTNGIYDYYDHLATLFGAEALGFAESTAAFRSALGLGPAREPDPQRLRLGLAPCCSGLSDERALLPSEWLEVLRRDLAPEAHRAVELHLFGAPSDKLVLEKLGALLDIVHPRLEIFNHAGKKLRESVLLLDQLDRLYCIDSALLHFARLLGKPTISYWGPTDPRVLLRPGVAQDTVHYHKLSCSPCVHMVDKAPCKGNNVCMRLAVNPEQPLDRSPMWVITSTP